MRSPGGRLHGRQPVGVRAPLAASKRVCVSRALFSGEAKQQAGHIPEATEDKGPAQAHATMA